METSGMQVAIVTQREGQLPEFRAAMEAHGFRVEFHRDAWSMLRSAKDRHWNLVVMDGLQTAFLESLMEANAGLNTAVLTDLDPQAFHEATEGLGILCSLPLRPSAADVEALLVKLRSVGGLDPRIEDAQMRLDAMSRKHHPTCVVCWDRHPFGLKVDFRATGEHSVEGAFGCAKFYEGYENVLHGGIVSTLLDGAMASCILAKGVEAYTVDMRIRYRAAVATGTPAMIRGEWLKSEGPIHLLQATLEQNGKNCASARAKFFEGKPSQPSRPLPGDVEVRELLRQARKRPS